VKKHRHILTPGTLERHQNTLRFVGENRTVYMPIETTAALHIFASVQLSSDLLIFLSRKGVTLYLYGYYGDFVASYLPQQQRASGSVTLRQATHYTDPSRRLDLARRFVEGALGNIGRVLAYYERRGVDVHEALEALDKARPQVAEQQSIEALMALEGGVRDSYYGVWDAILDNPDFPFERRSRRPPENRLNSLIGFGNTLLYSTCLSEIASTRLDPRISFLHSTSDRAYSLHFDLAEVFKPIIVDRVIFTLLNNKRLKAGSFREEGGVYLNDEGRKVFIVAYQDRLEETLKVTRTSRAVSYRTLVRQECLKLERHLLGEAPYVPYIAPR
jgi:CRISP-associated protein Cas1